MIVPEGFEFPLPFPAMGQLDRAGPCGSELERCFSHTLSNATPVASIRHSFTFVPFSRLCER